MLKKIIVRSLLSVFLLVVLSGMGSGIWLYQQIVKNPGDEIHLENIQKILGRESHVFYRDGMTPLGVFFDTSHRQYVHFEEIPQDFIDALVASEDSRFFDHLGFDLGGISRALVKNLKARRVVQGGSTLTQQTAKNLFKRENRSLEAKFKELLLALKLEYYYSKEQIFEFYANQFYVSGNGVGLGIAARYYFDKTPDELDLVECAFIAGSVNRPNYYNPFRKKTEEGVVLAQKRAQARLGYVLGEMYKLGMIDESTYNQAKETPIAFNQGQVGYAFDYVMDLVREAVSSDDVLDVLANHNIDNIATSGVRIITNVDQNLQRKTLAALRHHLSEIDVMLHGYNREEVQKELLALDYQGDPSRTLDAFLFGVIEKIHHQKGKVTIDVILDNKMGKGQITDDGLTDITSAWVKHERNNRNENIRKGDVKNFSQQLLPGDRVWVQITKLPSKSEDGEENSTEEAALVELKLARYPEVQGGAVIVQDGKIRAMAGGTENRFYNRAFSARRSMGSAFKPLVYAAAIQLGWNSADLLYNARAPFDYQGQPYFPRPDHYSPNNWVSMNWAGARSENLATVWLLSRLCDKLSALQFRDVAQNVGLVPQKIDGEEESYQMYSSRIRDEVGIVVNKSGLKEAAYRMALDSLEADFLFAGEEEEYRQLMSLPYGNRFDSYEQQIILELKQNSSARWRNELGQRKQMLQRNFLKLQSAYQPFVRFKDQVTKELNRFLFFEARAPIYGPLYKGLTDGAFYFLPFGGDVTAMIPFSGKALMDHLEKMNRDERRRFWENVRLNGAISVRALQKVWAQSEVEYTALLSRRPYDFEILQNIDEFRVAVGLYYLVELGKQMGVSSELAPVLSFPLGSNVVTPFELTRVYETLVTGSYKKYGATEEKERGNGAELTDALAIINRIESVDGEILYTPERTVVNLVDEKTSIAVNSILENVIRLGTGYYAYQQVRYHDQKTKNSYSVPLLGKTGTSNNYTNSSFFGYIPVADVEGEKMTVDGGYSVGVYCGYDDNRSMKHKRVRVSGSNGALPVWATIAAAILVEEDITAKLDPAALSFYGATSERSSKGELALTIDRERGGAPLARGQLESEEAVIRTFGSISSMGYFIPERNFSPFWLQPKEVLQQELKESAPKEILPQT